MSARSPETKRQRARAPRADQPDVTMGASSARQVTPLTAAELTQAFLAHEDQLSIIQAQTTIVFKLPAEGSIARALLAAVQGWQRDHHPGQAHPHGSCNQAVCAVLLHELAKSAVPTGLSQDSFQSFSEMAAELASQKTPAACWARSHIARHGQMRRRPTSFWTSGRCCSARSPSTQTPSSSFWRAMRGRSWAESRQEGSPVELEVALPTAAALPDSPSTAERVKCRPGAFFSFNSARGTAKRVPALLRCRVALTHVWPRQISQPIRALEYRS